MAFFSGLCYILYMSKLGVLTYLKNQKIFTSVKLFFLLVSFFAVLLSPSYASAAGFYGPGAGGGGGCGDKSAIVWNDTCFGVTWVYYEYNGTSNIDMSRDKKGNKVYYSNHAPASVVSGKCGRVGGFWHLGTETYNPQTDESYEYQRGTWWWGDVYNGNAKFIYPGSSVTPDSSRVRKAGNAYAKPVRYGSKSQVRKDFLAMKKAGDSDLRPGYDWDSPSSRLGWFCYGEGFSSRSTVKITSPTEVEKSSSSSGTNAASADITVRAGEQVSISFKHDLKLAQDLPNIPASLKSDWDVLIVDKSLPSGVLAPLPNEHSGTFKPTNDKFKTVSTTRALNFRVPDVANGTKYTICQRIKYNKNASDSSRDGVSKACATITVRKGPIPPKPDQCPVPGATAPVASQDYGETATFSAVANFSAGTGWLAGKTFAKPGDSIGFVHCLFSGVQAVRITGSHEKGATHVWRNTTNGRSTIPSSAASGNTKINASPSSNYFFGNASSNVGLRRGETKPIVTYSPSLNNTKYSCQYDPNNLFISSFIKGGYQIPGFNAPSAGCRNGAGGSGSYSDVGKTITQTQNFSGTVRLSAIPGGPDSWTMGRWEYYTTTCYAPKYDKKGNLIGYTPYSCTRSHYVTYNYSHTNNYYNEQSSYGTLSSSASVIIPYNYDTTVSTNIPSDPAVYGGEESSAHYEVSVVPRRNPDVNGSEPYATMTPPNTRVELVSFTIKPSLSANNGTLPTAIQGIESTYRSPCDFYRAKLGSNLGYEGCKVEKSTVGSLNPSGSLDGGDPESNSVKITIPDAEPGTKFCTAVGVSPSDSHNRPGADLGPGANASADNTSSNWKISHASCRTIAKKPNFQVWGSGFFNAGNLSTSTSHKTIYSNYARQTLTRLFGSWSEHETIAQGEVSGFASGATLGYNQAGIKANQYNPNVLFSTLPGGLVKGYDRTACQISSLTVSNQTCSSGVTGNADIKGVSPRDDVVNRMLMRYTLPTSRSLEKYPAASCPKLYAPGATSADGTIRKGAELAHQSCVQLSDNVRYLRVEAPYAILADNVTVGERNNPVTLVIHVVGGTLQIDGDIRYIHPSDHGEAAYQDIASLSQALIFAKDINIGYSNGNIDAWLFALGSSTYPKSAGVINTCYPFRPGSRGPGVSSDVSHCHNPLTINGPIFAGKLRLYRTGGAGVGDRSIDPAERFDLRPDTYLWAYSQAQRFSQAISTYTRELAPRY